MFLALLALHLLGLLRLPFADRDVRVHLANRPVGHAGTFAVGVAFGAGWTPCIGPALASILTLAAADASLGQGMGLLAVYSLGLAIPFLLATVALDRFMAETSRLRTWLPRLQRASGVLILHHRRPAADRLDDPTGGIRRAGRRSSPCYGLCATVSPENGAEQRERPRHLMEEDRDAILARAATRSQCARWGPT